MSWNAKSSLWMGWALTTAGIAGFGTYSFRRNDARAVHLPGPTTHGHYQIELACESCHTEAFADRETLQAACEGCHAEELRAADDSHPQAKFTDPRNADRVARLDARECVTCHVEHRPELTSEMGLTMPVDYCVRCHEEVGTERPSHEGMAFDTCASAGCHNFHDNRGLYEDFLRRHANEPDLLSEPTVLARNAPAAIPAVAGHPEGFDASAHAVAEVGCEDCHRATREEASGWIESPSHETCAECHAPETDGFLAGRHGMRIAAGLSPMRPELARQPMRESAAHRELGCTSCHGAHRFDTVAAAVDACLECHADDHSRAYRGSPHDVARAESPWERVVAGEGVTCATCHMPRVRDGGEVRVTHNQNDNLRPNEKMLRTVCLRCHGLGFALDALADASLVLGNFRGRPGAHVESIEMAERRR